MTLDHCIKYGAVFKSKGITLCIGKYVTIGKVRALTQFAFEVRQLKEFIREYPCDIYHAHWAYEFALAPLSCVPDKTIVTLHDWGERVYEFMHDYYRKRRLQMSYRALKKAKNITCVSDYIRNLYVNKYQNEAALTINNYYCERDVFHGEKTLRDCNQMIVASAHGFNELKNTARIIDAFKLIRESIPSASLYMYGCGHGTGEEAEQYAKEKSAAEGIHFIGPVEHDVMIEAFREADLVVHASMEESFGLVVIEALINKTPVIGNYFAGGVKEILSQVSGGILVDGTKAVDIAEAAIMLLLDSEKWSFLSSVGQQAVMKGYSSDTIAQKYLSFYRMILAES